MPSTDGLLARIGSLASALALPLAYLGVASQAHWWPFQSTAPSVITPMSPPNQDAVTPGGSTSTPSSQQSLITTTSNSMDTSVEAEITMSTPDRRDMDICGATVGLNPGLNASASMIISNYGPPDTLLGMESEISGKAVLTDSSNAIFGSQSVNKIAAPQGKFFVGATLGNTSLFQGETSDRLKLSFRSRGVIEPGSTGEWSSAFWS